MRSKIRRRVYLRVVGKTLGAFLTAEILAPGNTPLKSGLRRNPWNSLIVQGSFRGAKHHGHQHYIVRPRKEGRVSLWYGWGSSYPSLVQSINGHHMQSTVYTLTVQSVSSKEYVATNYTCGIIQANPEPDRGPKQARATVGVRVTLRVSGH